MSEDRKRVLKMVADGKITIDQADRLLRAFQDKAQPGQAGGDPQPDPVRTKARPKYLKVVVDSNDGEHVNIRVPLGLLRAGMKLSRLLPDEAREKIDCALNIKGVNVDIDGLAGEGLEDLIEQLTELQIDVDGGGGERVRIFCE